MSAPLFTRRRSKKSAVARRRVDNDHDSDDNAAGSVGGANTDSAAVTLQRTLHLHDDDHDSERADDGGAPVRIQYRAQAITQPLPTLQSVEAERGAISYSGANSIAAELERQRQLQPPRMPSDAAGSEPMAVDDSGDGDNGYQSSTSATIQLLKEKRRMARHRGVANSSRAKPNSTAMSDAEDDDAHRPGEEFISLAGDGQLSDADIDQPAADNDDDDGDDLNMEDDNDAMLPFGLRAVKARNERQQLEMRAALERNNGTSGSGLNIYDNDLDVQQPQSDSEHGEEDEELFQWEMQQIRKGAAGGQVVDLAGLKAAHRPRKKNRQLPDSVPSTMPPFTSVIDELNEQLAQMRASHQVDFSNLSHLNSEKQRLDEQLALTDSQVAAAGEEYNVFQDFQQWLVTFTALMEAKMPLVDEAIVRSTAAMDRRRKEVEARRTELWLDDMAQLTGRVPTEDESVNGSSVSMGRQFRKMRHQRRQNKRSQQQHWHEEGMSSDDEDIPPPDGVEDASKLLNGDQGASGDEVEDSFKSLPSILSRLEIWRTNYPTEYRSAHIGQSVADLVQLFVKMSLPAGWDPLGSYRPQYSAIKQLDWYGNVAKYVEAAVSSNTGDNQILPFVVDKHVTPYLTRIVFGANLSAYDPYSRRQTVALAAAITDIASYRRQAEISTDNFAQLLSALSTRLLGLFRDNLVTLLRPLISVRPYPVNLLAIYSPAVYSCLAPLVNITVLHQQLAPIQCLPPIDQFLDSVGVKEYLYTCILPLVHGGVVTIQHNLNSLPPAFAWHQTVVAMLERVVELTPAAWFDGIAVDGMTRQWRLIGMLVGDMLPALALNSDAVLWNRVAALLVRVGEFERAASMGTRNI